MQIFNQLEKLTFGFIILIVSSFLSSEEPDTDIDPLQLIQEALNTPYMYQSVNIITGEYCESETDLRFKGPYPLQLKRCYTSQDPAGYGWYFNHPNIVQPLAELSDTLSDDKISYSFDEKNRLKQIVRFHANEQTCCHTLQFQYEEGETTECKVTANDGQWVRYTFRPYESSRGPRSYLLETLCDSKGKEVRYTYREHPRERRKLLKKREEQEGRYLISEYYDASANNVGGEIVHIKDPARDPRIGKVKLQKAPVGSDETPIITHRFFYEPGFTRVYDALGNKTIYRYGKQGKITTIEQFWDEQSLYRKERFFWDDKGRRLVSRCLEDGKGIVHLCHTFDYDLHGNVIKHTLWGDLSGAHNTPPITLDSSGKPVNNGAEHYTLCFRYSENGKFLLSQKDEEGVTARYLYDETSSLMTAKWIYDGEVLKLRHFYRYDEEGNLIETVIDDGFNESCEDLSGVSQRQICRLTPLKENHALGLPAVIEEFFFNLEQGEEEQIRRTEIFYNEKGDIERQVFFDAEREHALTIENSYDTKGSLITTRDTLGRYQEVSYDRQGNPLKIVNNHSEVLKVYDLADRLIRQEIKENGEITAATSYRFDYKGQMIASCDRFGNETLYQYDPLGRKIKTTFPKVYNPGGKATRPSTSQTYDIFDRESSSTDSKGFTTTTRYNVRGKPIEVIYPDGSREQFKYNLNGSLKESIRPNGSRVVYQRDFLSRVTQEEHYGQEGELAGVKTYRYSSFHLLEETEFDGSATCFSYDGAGRQILIFKEGGLRVETVYDALGQVKARKEWYGEEQEEYVLGVIERNYKNEEKAFELCDSHGRILKRCCKESEASLRANSVEDHHYFNELGQNVLRKTEVDQAGHLLITTFDALGRVVNIEKQNPLGNALSRKEIRYDPVGNKAREIYENLSSDSEPKIYMLGWEWGPGNRIEKMIEGYGSPKARETHYFYNDAGELTTVLKPDGVSLFFSYNAKGEIETVKSSDYSIDYLYIYDGMGRVIQAEDRLKKTMIQRAYNVEGRLMSEDLGNGRLLRSSYDLLGRRTSLILPDTSEIHWKYNAAFLTEVERYSAKGDKLYSYAYAGYDLEGRSIEEEMIKGLGKISRSYRDEHLESIHSPYWSESHTFDSLGRLTHTLTTDPIGQLTWEFQHDDSSQLTEEKGLFQNSYTYDSIHNILSCNHKGFEVDELNQLIAAGANTFSYDLNGQMIESSDQRGHLFYVYDALGRLVEATKDREYKVRFDYDPFGRRLSKTIAYYDLKGRTYVNQTTEYFLWDGENEIGMIDPDHILTQLRVMGLGLGMEVGAAVAIELNGSLFAPIHDHRGGIRCLIDVEKEKPCEWYHYSAYGEEERYSLHYESSGNPWRFSSKRVDEEIGLVFFGKRYYLPSIGRWITKDPLGTPESVNRYAYALNQPLQRIDPTGLFSIRGFWNKAVSHLQSFLTSTFLSLNTLRNHLNFDDFVGPSVKEAGELCFGHFFLQLSGFYKDVSEAGVHGKGELNEKVRITLINGILNARLDYKESLDFISDSHGGVNIHYIFDASQGWTGDLFRAIASRLGYTSPSSYQLAVTWKKLIEEMGGVGEGGLVIHYAHSIGAAHTKTALSLLTPEERKMIRVYTFGTPSVVQDTGLESVKNFISYRDGVSLFDPLGFITGLLGISDQIVMVGSPFGIPFVEHMLSSGCYSEIIKILGVHFMQHYLK